MGAALRWLPMNEASTSLLLHLPQPFCICFTADLLNLSPSLIPAMYSHLIRRGVHAATQHFAHKVRTPSARTLACQQQFNQLISM